MTKSSAPLPRLARTLEYVCSALMAALIGLLFLQVVARYLLASPPTWTEEIARTVFIYVTYFAAAVAIGRRANLKIDVVVNLLPERLRWLIALGLHVVAIIFLGVVVYESIGLVRVVANQRMVSLPISQAYIFVALPIGGTLMLLFEAVVLVRRIRRFPENYTPAHAGHPPEEQC